MSLFFSSFPFFPLSLSLSVGYICASRDLMIIFLFFSFFLLSRFFSSLFTVRVKLPHKKKRSTFFLSSFFLVDKFAYLQNLESNEEEEEEKKARENGEISAYKSECLLAVHCRP